jgi:hypothetical protein
MTHPLRPGALPELLEAAVGRGGRNGRGSSRLQVLTIDFHMIFIAVHSKGLVYVPPNHDLGGEDAH